MAFPQYRIPVERLKEEWAYRERMQKLNNGHPTPQPSKITDYGIPLVKHPTSVAELWEIACKINKSVEKP